MEAPESWLQKGFLYIEALKDSAENELSAGVSCPFCQQSIDNSLDIITAYTAQFNAEFNSLVDRLKSHLIKVQSFNLDLSLLALKNIDEANVGRIASWATHLPAGAQQPTSSIIPDETALKELYQLLIDAITSKLQNPSAAITQTAATSFKTSLQTINGNVFTYNSNVTAYNAAITAFRTSIQTVPQAQATLEELNRIKLRFDPSISQVCIQLISEKQRLDALERSYRQLNQQQQQAVNTFFNSYKNRVNHYLGPVFKTPFKIEDVTHIPPQGRATYNKIGYKLTIEGHDISFDINQANSAKDCLSEGDKSTIALALFLSKLDIDPALSNKIVIFDDPLSSFDTNRRMYTVQILKDLLPRIKQLIVLSHNEFFLHDISNGIAPNDKKILRISQNYTTNASVIAPLDLDTLVENAYFKNVKELELFLTQPDITKKDTILGLLRNVLEAHIRFKFYRQLAHVPSSHQTFGALITTLDNQGITFRDNTNRASIISKLKTINSISWRPHHGEPIPDYTSLGVNPSTITETELANVINDTLRLIDIEI